GSYHFNGYTSNDIAGSMRGMLINDGNHAVTTFALRNTSSGSNDHIAGTILTSGSEVPEIGWGNWDNPLPENWNQEFLTQLTGLFNNYILTPSFIINRLTGSYEYSDPTGFGKSSIENGTVEIASASFQVNFDDSAADVISYGQLQVNATD